MSACLSLLFPHLLWVSVHLYLSPAVLSSLKIIFLWSWKQRRLSNSVLSFGLHIKLLAFPLILALKRKKKKNLT